MTLEDFLMRRNNRSHAENISVSNVRTQHCDEYIEEFWETFGGPIEDFDPSQYGMVKPDRLTLRRELHRYCRGEHDLPPEYEEAYFDALSTVREKLNLPRKVSFVTAEDISLKSSDYETSDAHPGFYYSRRGFRTRSEAREDAESDAITALDELCSGVNVEPDVVLLRSNGKRIDFSDRSGRVGRDRSFCRVVFMPSLRDILLLGSLQNKIHEAYMRWNFPIALGLNWFRGSPKEFIDQMREFKKFFCIDATRFDSSVSGWLVRDAIDIIRDQIDDGFNENHDAYFEFLRKSVIHTIIKIPWERQIVKKSTGTCTGLNFNTLIQSIITLVMGQTALNFLTDTPSDNTTCITNSSRMMSFGDDCIIGVRDQLSNISLEDIIEVVQQAFGVEWSNTKTFSTEILVDDTMGDFGGIKFLGKWFWNERLEAGGVNYHFPTPYRPFSDTLLQLYHPTSGGRTLGDTLERCRSLYMDAAGNTETEVWLKRLFLWLLTKEGEGREGYECFDHSRFFDRERWIRKTHFPSSSADPSA